MISSVMSGERLAYRPWRPLAKEFTKARKTDEAGFPTAAERKVLTEELGVEIGDKEYSRNLERLMELLFSLRFALSRSAHAKAKDNLTTVNSIIQKVQAFLVGQMHGRRIRPWEQHR